MTTLDPSTNLPLPPSAIQRVLHITSKVHVYQIPPLTSSQGHKASTWTTNPPIFSPRLRVLETAIPQEGTEKVSLAILLEDPSTGELFAAAPYTHPATVAQASDSSRFFAVRVVGEGGMKATLGVGFEERTEAFDFGVALQDAGRALGFGGGAAGTQGKVGGSSSSGGKKVDALVEKPKDYSLKEGQTITVNIGTRNHNSKASVNEKQAVNPADPAAPVPFLPPPPSAADVKSAKHSSGDLSSTATQKPALHAAELGFDDGEFGEFQ